MVQFDVLLDEVLTPNWLIRLRTLDTKPHSVFPRRVKSVDQGCLLQVGISKNELNCVENYIIRMDKFGNNFTTFEGHSDGA